MGNLGARLKLVEENELNKYFNDVEEMVKYFKYFYKLNPRLFILISDVIFLNMSFLFGGIFGYLVNVYGIDRQYRPIFSGDEIINRAIYYAIVICVAIFWMARKGRYSEFFGGWRNLEFSTQAIILALILDTVIQYSTKQNFSRLWLFGGWTAALFFLPISYSVVRRIMLKRTQWARPVVLLGSIKMMKAAEAALNTDDFGEYKVSGRVALEHENWDLGSNPTLQTMLREARAANAYVVIAPRAHGLKGALSFCRNLERSRLKFLVVPDLGEEMRRGLFKEMQFMGGVPVISGLGQLANPVNRLVKSVFDFIVCILAIFIFLPLMIIVAVLVSVDGGPIFYGHSRIGKGGKQFKCLKFRSMKVDADAQLKKILETDLVARSEWERDFKLRCDPRITKIGRLLRKMSLDEFPQLINVIRGEMSLVGPRPVVERELEEYYGSESILYTSVKPGITGLWQVSGRNDSGYDRRVDLDCLYSRTWSLPLDVRILLKTIPVVLTRKGAY